MAERATIPSIGKRVKYDGKWGLVRFVGYTKFAPNLWVGLEMDESVGQSDGTVDGVEYFRCMPAHGMFARPADVEMEDPASPPPPRSQQSGSLAPNYQSFVEKMRQPAASELIKAMKSFIRSFENGFPAESQSDIVGGFFEDMEEHIRGHPLWSEGGEEEVDTARDGVEKFVMTKIYDKAFMPEEEADRDRLLSEKFRKLQFIDAGHLGISGTYLRGYPWLPAQAELLKMNQYRTPRDKLICILNCCKRISNSLSSCHSGHDRAMPTTFGADEFFPVFVFVLIKANPASLYSNLQYISKFRHPQKLVAESAYYLTHGLSAVEFVEGLTADQLGIDPDEFDQHMREPPPDHPPDSIQQQISLQSPAKLTPASVAEMESVPVLATSIDRASSAYTPLSVRVQLRVQRASDTPPSFRFAAVPSASALAVADLPELLEEYKWLCRTLHAYNEQTLPPQT